jgi:membrane protease YdiL (CAAX protease family)
VIHGAAPIAPPPLGYLLAGFLLLVVGLAWLWRTRPRELALRSPQGTRRAIGYGVVFTLTSACFARVANPALAGTEHSPWLLALADVLFATQILFAWILLLVEDLPARDLGLRWAGGRRAGWAWLLCLAMPIVASLPHYLQLFRGKLPFSTDAAVFAGLFALGASSLPQEIIYRGYLQGSLEGRMALAPRVLLQAVLFAAFHLGRVIPGVDVSWSEFLVLIFGLLIPAGLFWGAMRELAGGSILPVLVSHFLLRLAQAWVTATPGAG